MIAASHLHTRRRFATADAPLQTHISFARGYRQGNGILETHSAHPAKCAACGASCMKSDFIDEATAVSYLHRKDRSIFLVNNLSYSALRSKSVKHSPSFSTDSRMYSGNASRGLLFVLFLASRGLVLGLFLARNNSCVLNGNESEEKHVHF